MARSGRHSLSARTQGGCLFGQRKGERAGFHGLPHGALAEAFLDEWLGAGDQVDQASERRCRDLSEKPIDHPTGWRHVARAERRMAGKPVVHELLESGFDANGEAEKLVFNNGA